MATYKRRVGKEMVRCLSPARIHATCLSTTDRWRACGAPVQRGGRWLKREKQRGQSAEEETGEEEHIQVAGKRHIYGERRRS